MPDIGNALLQARSDRGLSRMKVAHMVTASENQIYCWETGRNVPSADTLRKYVEAGLLSRESAADLLLGAA